MAICSLWSNILRVSVALKELVCWNISHCQQQQFFSELHQTGAKYSTDFCSGLEQNYNLNLPFGQASLKFYLPGQDFYKLLFQFSSREACPYPCPSGKWVGKVTCPTQKSTCPGRPDGTFFEPCCYGWIQTVYWMVFCAVFYSFLLVSEKSFAPDVKLECCSI